MGIKERGGANMFSFQLYLKKENSRYNTNILIQDVFMKRIGASFVAFLSLLTTSAYATTVSPLPIELTDTTGGFVATHPSPNPVNGINAVVTGIGSGQTSPFDPVAGGANLANFLGANIVFNYVAGNPLVFDLLSNNNSVFTKEFLVTGLYNIDLKSVVPVYANTNLVIRFSVNTGTGTTEISNIKALITTKTPQITEPKSILGIGLFGLGLIAGIFRDFKNYRNFLK